MIGPQTVTEEDVHQNYEKAAQLEAILLNAETEAKSACRAISANATQMVYTMDEYAKLGLPITRHRTETMLFSRWNSEMDYDIVTDIRIDNRQRKKGRRKIRLSTTERMDMIIDIQKIKDEQTRLTSVVQEACDRYDKAYCDLLAATIIEEPVQQAIKEHAIIYITTQHTNRMLRTTVNLYSGWIDASYRTTLPKDRAILHGKMVSEADEYNANTYIVHKPGNVISDDALLKHTVDLLRARYFESTGRQMPEDLEFRSSVNTLLDATAGGLPYAVTLTDTFADEPFGFSCYGVIPQEIIDAMLEPEIGETMH